MNRRSLGHRAPLLWLLLPLMTGLVAGKLQWLPLSPVGWSVAAVVAIFAAFLHPRAWAPCLVTGVFLGGAALYDLRRDRLTDWDHLPPREVRVTLQIDRVFPPRDADWNPSGLGLIVASDAHLPELVGQRVYFSLTLPKSASVPIRTTRLAVTGVLQTLPRNPPSDTFDGYLAAQGMNFKLTRARLTGAITPPGVYPEFRDAALHRFNAILSKGIAAHPQHGTVLRAMLLGQQHELTDDQKNVFRESGTMHLFSISGLHIAVIAGVIHVLLSLLRLPPLVRVVVGGAFLWLYVDITGATPSAVRAFLMVMFLHASHVLRVPGNPFSALVASAVCVLLIEPMQLFSASFQLSYGIVAALLLLGLPLGELWMERAACFTSLPKLSWRWYHHTFDACWRWTLGVVAIGLSTSVVSAISGVVIFKLFTPVSLLANLVLIPVGSLVIISGFLSLLFGLIGLGAISLVLNYASVLLLMAIERGVLFFVGVPGAFRPAEFSAEWLGYSALAGLLAVILFGYAHNWDLKRGGFWPPFAFTALALAAGIRFIATP